MPTSQSELVPACKLIQIILSNKTFDLKCHNHREYDFYSFNNINGSVNVHVLVSPILNSYGLDRPVAIATQLDDDEIQAQYFIPSAAPGDLPAQWDGNDGWVANAIIDVLSTHVAAPGSHTLKVWN